jgi:hypothetical protein
MSEELKNKIRRERIRELLNDRIKRKYSPMTLEKTKDITKEDIIELRKGDCIQYLKILIPYIKDIDTITETFKEMDIDEVLLLTYRINLWYNIILYEHSDNVIKEKLTVDALEERLISLEEKKELKKIMERCKVPNDTKKSWWNIF